MENVTRTPTLSRPAAGRVGRATHRSLAIAGALALALSGCAEWEELPDEAVGFLNPSDVSVSGTVDGAEIVRTRGASGYCTPSGWRLDIEAVTEHGDRIINTIEMRDLDLRGRDTTVRFVVNGSDLTVENDRERGQLKLATCVGDEDAPTFEQEATEVMMDVQSDGWGSRVDVAYTATFDSGDQMQGQFQLDMPLVD